MNVMILTSETLKTLITPIIRILDKKKKVDGLFVAIRKAIEECSNYLLLCLLL